MSWEPYSYSGDGESLPTSPKGKTTDATLGQLVGLINNHFVSHKLGRNNTKSRHSMSLGPTQPRPEIPINDAFKSGVQRILSRNIDLLYQSGRLRIDNNFETLDDIDFVFVVRKQPSRSLSFRCANWLARTLSRGQVTEEDMTVARYRYLNGLKSLYRIAFTKISGQEFDYYPIKLSFYHLGLMMQLLGYQWRIKTDNEEKSAFKTFYFMKREVERYKEYHNCEQRSDFTARWRYDLAFHFLVGASVPVANVNPWRSLLRQRSSNLSMNPPENIDEERHTTPKEKHYTLLQLLADELFDDWLVPHSPIRERTQENVISVVADIEESGSRSEICCAKCCFPCWTCQWKEAEEGNLSEQYDKDNCCGICGTALW